MLHFSLNHVDVKNDLSWCTKLKMFVLIHTLFERINTLDVPSLALQTKHGYAQTKQQVGTLLVHIWAIGIHRLIKLIMT